jgi:hypothetical protein
LSLIRLGDQIGQFFANWATSGSSLGPLKDFNAQTNGDVLGYILLKQI